MDYLKFSFPVSDRHHGEVLLAALIDLDFEGFEEDGAFLHAYAPYSDSLVATANQIGEQHQAYPVLHEQIADQNWNARWESEFAPVIVGDFCTVRADFHDIVVRTTYEVVITPKMSFGTGHHDTTRLMIAQMQHVSFLGKNVLDFGTGTGILAILAAKLGATEVHAVDNDSWAYENACENITANGHANIAVWHGTLEDVPSVTYDVILANINRHILLDTLPELYRKLASGGRIFMSGLLLEDADIVYEAAAEVGFIMRERKAGGNWLLLDFAKAT